jgi:hypothetical protein
MLTMADRFWAKVDKNGPVNPQLGSRCWHWRAALDRYGYGKFGTNARLAHRVAWELTYGKTKKLLDHHRLCERKCVNPAHLRPVSVAQNNQNRTVKSRSKSGFRGVRQVGPTMWEAYVHFNKKQVYVGRYPTRELAAEAARLRRMQLYTHNDADREESCNKNTNPTTWNLPSKS